VVAATLVAGTAVLGATLAAPSGSVLFYGLGLLAAFIWIVGARLSGPIPGLRSAGTGGRGTGILVPMLLGALLFGAFFVAKLVADQVSVLSGSVASVLARADAGPLALALAVALVNGVGEEVFFRGALHSAFGKNRPGVWATAIYCVVTIATLNVALVVAALVMGTVFTTERRITGGVRAPILTHLTWSTLMVLLLPR
jgi:membrane protease YdiL (CAAX protease family)